MKRDYYGVTFDDYLVQTKLKDQLDVLDAEISAATAAGDLDTVQRKTQLKADWIDGARDTWKTSNDYRGRRSEEYPALTDQLDAILKQMVKLQQAGIALDADMTAIITKWQAVKTKYPKPVQ